MSIGFRTKFKRRRVADRVEWNPGELIARVGFVVTHIARSAGNVVAFYNKRRAREQWVKEGESVIKWARLSCRSFASKTDGRGVPK